MRNNQLVHSFVTSREIKCSRNAHTEKKKNILAKRKSPATLLLKSGSNKTMAFGA